MFSLSHDNRFSPHFPFVVHEYDGRTKSPIQAVMTASSGLDLRTCIRPQNPAKGAWSLLKAQCGSPAYRGEEGKL